MRLLIFLLLLCNGHILKAQSFVNHKLYKGVAQQYHPLLDSALKKAGNNKKEIIKALSESPKDSKEGMAFLIAYMPEHDLQAINSKFLLDNTRLAYAVRKLAVWQKNIPDSIFYNDVLPYAVVNENRDEWRTDFHKRFSKYVANAQTLPDAIHAINKNIRDEVLVDYNTKRRKADQSPAESIEQGMASCTGLTILLIDAFRSVGIPARFAGTSNWYDNRGNHSWCEVWVGDKWAFTEYYPSPLGLDNSWFLADAGKANASNPEYAIYASSYKPTGVSYPMVWTNAKYVSAINVTQRYIDLYEKENKLKAIGGNHIALSVAMFKNIQNQTQEDRIKENIDIFCGNDQVGGGSTTGALQDANDILTFIVEKHKTYTLKYSTKSGPKESIVTITDKPFKVALFAE